MKTLQELYNEIATSDELKAALAEAAEDGKVTEFLKTHDCEATKEDLVAFLRVQTSGKLTDEELAARPQQPLKRQRVVSKALRAYAQSVSSADKGGVRFV